MKLSFALIVVISLFFTGAQGIRFKKGLFSFVGQHHERFHEEERKTLIKTSNDDGRKIHVCKDCNSGLMNRKLISTTTTTTSTGTTSTAISKNNEGDNSTSSTSGERSRAGNPSSYNSPPTSDDDHNEDLTDIAEMDYSPARKKPPIHN